MPKVHYFPIYGKGEAIKMALHYLGVEFESVDHVGETWQPYKPNTPFGQMPVLDLDDGTSLAQSMAIINYIGATWGGNKLGFVPTDPMQNYNGEATVAVITDDFFSKHIMAAFYMPDGDEKTAKWQNIVSVEYPKTAALLEPRIPAEGFLNGPNLSKWDILFVQFYVNMLRNPTFRYPEQGAAMWAATPANIQAYVQRVEEVFKDYLAQRPKNTY